MEFKTEKELLDFVLTECGDMVYTISQEKDSSRNLMVEGNADMERIYYAIKLLEDDFGVIVDNLDLIEDYVELKEGWLDKTKIEILGLCEGVKLPTLPKTMKTIYWYNQFSDLCKEIQIRENTFSTKDYYRARYVITVKIDPYSNAKIYEYTYMDLDEALLDIKNDDLEDHGHKLE